MAKHLENTPVTGPSMDATDHSHDPQGAQEYIEFKEKVSQTMLVAERDVMLVRLLSGGVWEEWDSAKAIVADFEPVPWFIWRLTNHVYGRVGAVGSLPEGLVLGLRRLMSSAASDPLLGGDKDVNSLRNALKVLKRDVVASVSVIHSISRRLHSKGRELAWGPLLDEAITRAQLGFFVGQVNLNFGPGRGMLAGFASCIGLPILLSMGEERKANEAMRLLALGSTHFDVGMDVYGLDPLMVSAVALAAAGCGIDATCGTLAHAKSSQQGGDSEVPLDRQLWHASYCLIEAARKRSFDGIVQEQWDLLGFCEEEDRKELRELATMTLRKGHGWNWMVSAPLTPTSP